LGGRAPVVEIELDGLRALVDAASAGVGRASARALAVAVASSDAGRAGDAAAEITAASTAGGSGVRRSIRVGCAGLP
jgi:hypothetical protein